MNSKLNNYFTRLRKRGFYHIFDFLEPFEIIDLRYTDSRFRNYFKESKLPKMYLFLINFDKHKWGSNLKNKKLKLLSFMTDHLILDKVSAMFNVDIDIVISACKDLANYYNNLEFKILNIEFFKDNN